VLQVRLDEFLRQVQELVSQNQFICSRLNWEECQMTCKDMSIQLGRIHKDVFKSV
jgi:hypothetical protein